MPILSVHQLAKSFRKGKIPAVRGVDFEVEKGEIYGIIGPDGAGKTTLFRMLASLLLPDAGKAMVCGHDVVEHSHEVHQLMGYMPGRFALYADLSVEENLQFFAALYHTSIEKNYAWIADIYRQISPFKDRRAGKLSGGMKQKLALCCSLIHAPQILLLDEPTTGVDPVSRKEFWETLRRLKEEGLTVLVSTPYMDEALLCDRIALMQEGRFLQVDTPQHIIDSYEGNLWAVRTGNMHRLLNDLRTWPGVRSAFSFGENVHVGVEQGVCIDHLQHYLENLGHSEVAIRPISPTIEDCFMKLMQQNEGICNHSR